MDSLPVTFRQIPATDAARLKAAMADLVQMAGGVTAAAEALQMPPSRVSEAASAYHMDRWFNILHIAELECVTGQPVMATLLADLSDCEVVPRVAKPQPSLHDAIARHAREAGEVQAVVMQALADGNVTAREADAIRREIDDDIKALQDLRATLDQGRR